MAYVQRTDLVEASAPGQDSFLDTMANMTGILIILVMIAGMRVRNAPAEVAADATATAAIAQGQLAEQSLTAEVWRIVAQTRDLVGALQTRMAERAALQMTLSAWEQRLAAKRRELDAAQQADFDAARAAAEAKARLEELERKRLLVAAIRPEAIEIKNFPTPLSRTVDSDEAHFQLRGGRIAPIPLEELIARFKTDAEGKVYKLRDDVELTEIVGPIGGFRLRYHLERRDTPPEDALRSGRSTSVVRLTRWELLPVTAELGEDVDEALADGSQFRQALANCKPGRTTLTLWTYPDSFASFRRLKEVLYAAGFATAARPLPADILIGGSPEGSKSAAE